MQNEKLRNVSLIAHVDLVGAKATTLRFQPFC